MGNHIVKDLRSAPKFEPCSLVASATVQEIEYGIVVFACRIGWREIDGHAAHTIAGGRVVNLFDRAMLDIMILHEGGAVVRENEVVEIDVHITHYTGVERVENMIAVNEEIVLIEVVRQFVGGIGERAVGLLSHIVVFALQNQADMLCIGIGVGESNNAFGRNLLSETEA